MAGNPEKSISDAHLIQQLQAKDMAALEWLYNQYAAALFGVIVRAIQDEEKAEDVLVNCFAAIWQQASDYKPGREPILAWMVRICQNLLPKKKSARPKAENDTGALFGAASTAGLRQINLQQIEENAILPRPKLKEKVLHRISELSMQAAGPDKDLPVNASPEIHFVKKKRDKYQWLLAMCFTLFILSSILNFYLYQRWKRTKNKLADAREEQLRLTENLHASQNKIAQLQTSVVVLEDDQMKRVKMAGQKKSPESAAVIHFNPKTSQVFLELKQLPLPPEKYQYQLWALDKGKPVNAGLIDTSTSLEGMQEMNKIKQVRTFLITLEPMGGSPEPTLDELYLMGKL